MKDRAISLNAAIEAIYSCAVGGKKYIENAPMSDHFAEGLYDAVSAIEDLPSVTPCEDAISRQAVLVSIKNLYPDMPIVDILGARRKWLEKYAPYFECENVVEQLPPVKPQYTADEIQKMQDLEQAEIQKAYELGKAEAGHWVSIEIQGEIDGQIVKAFICSECGAISLFRITGGKIVNGDLCPNCGCRMVEPQESEE